MVPTGNADEMYLRRAIRLAMNGRGSVEPNPMVGCVIVKNERIIGEGLHRQYGFPHAEPDALANCTESTKGATAYVTLEPCCHIEKQTPPCVPRFIAAKIARVVVGTLDPNPQVNGNGIRQLREAGIVVDAPVLDLECKQLIAPFVARIKSGRGYLTMKWAQSADGKIAGPGGKRVQISDPSSSEKVQWLRSRSDAVMVGINTVLNDDPTLMPRGVPIRKGFRRMVLDRRARLPIECRLVQTIKDAPVIVYCDDLPDVERGLKLVEAGVVILPTHGWQFDPTLSHILIEPGPTLARAKFQHVDRLWVIYSPKIIGAETAPAAAEIPGYYIKTGEIDLDGDRLCEYLNTKSDAYFAPVASADLVLSKQ